MIYTLHIHCDKVITVKGRIRVATLTSNRVVFGSVNEAQLYAQHCHTKEVLHWEKTPDGLGFRTQQLHPWNDIQAIMFIRPDEDMELPNYTRPMQFPVPTKDHL